jgi:dihydrofolate synthase / folylpolyglutamate synthase
MIVSAVRTRIFKQGEDLVEFIAANIARPKEGIVLVVTSKIVALAEGRVVENYTPIDRARIIQAESEFALETKYAWLTIKDGTVMASAGTDESNADGALILLPKDSYAWATRLRNALKKKWKLRKLGVLITDSRILPLRAGVVGVALGYAGFKGVKDYRGTRDLFGRVLKVSRTDVADSLATAAVLEMGEGREQRPLATIENPPIVFTERVNKNELKIALEDDLYYPLFRRAKKK